MIINFNLNILFWLLTHIQPIKCLIQPRYILLYLDILWSIVWKVLQRIQWVVYSHFCIILLFVYSLTFEMNSLYLSFLTLINLTQFASFLRVLNFIRLSLKIIFLFVSFFSLIYNTFQLTVLKSPC